jgi:hypothetical protein
VLAIKMWVDTLLHTTLTEWTNVAFRDGRLTTVYLKVPLRAEGDWIDLATAELICQNNGRITFHYTDTAEVALEQLDADNASKGDKMVVQPGSLITHENNTIANSTTNAT